MTKSNQNKLLILEQLRKNPIIEAACQKVGISRMTLLRWKKADPKFAKEVEAALLDGQLLVNDLAESQLIAALKDRNMQAIMYWLKHHHADYKSRLELEGNLNLIQELDPEQKELVEQAYKLLGITINYYEKQETVE